MTRILPAAAVVIIGAVVWIYAGDLNPPAGPIQPTMKTLAEIGSSLRPSELIQLGTSNVSPGQVADALRGFPDATGIGGAFTPPRGMVFVLTDIMFFPTNPGGGTITMRINQNTRAREVYIFPADRPFQAHLRTGEVFASGFAIRIENFGSSDGTVRARLLGFLTEDN
jgi:hypothetical protein